MKILIFYDGFEKGGKFYVRYDLDHYVKITRKIMGNNWNTWKYAAPALR